MHTYFVPSERNSFRPHSLSRNTLMFVLSALLFIEAGTIGLVFLQSYSPQFMSAVIESSILSLTNTKRVEAGSTALVRNEMLARAAQAKAEDMAERGYFSHIGPGGKEPWAWMLDGGYDYAYAGENLAVRFSDSSEVVSAWMDSPSHRANVLRPVYTDIGIGVAQGMYEGRETTFVVQFFGTPRNVVKTSASVVSAIASTTAKAPSEVGETPREASLSPLAPSALGKSTVRIPSSIARLLSSPEVVAFSLLSAVATMLVLALLFAIFIRIHIQPVDLLLNGAVMVAFVFALILINKEFLQGARLPAQGLSAAIEAL